MLYYLYQGHTNDAPVACAASTWFGLRALKDYAVRVLGLQEWYVSHGRMTPNNGCVLGFEFNFQTKEQE